MNAGKITTTGATVWESLAATADDTTPTVGTANVLTIPATWTSSHDITALDDGTAGQVVVVVGGDADCNVIDGGTLDLAGDWNAAASASLTLVRGATNWHEVSRVAPIVYGPRRIWLGPEDAIGNGSAYTAMSNGVQVSSLAVTDSSASSEYWTVVLPHDYVAGSSITIKLYSLCGAATPAGDVEWTFTSVVCGDGDGLDTAYGNSIAIVESYDTKDDVVIFEEADAALFGATASPGDLVAVKLYRDPADADDDLGEVAYVLGVEITW
jgi:hypothetical protein